MDVFVVLGRRFLGCEGVCLCVCRGVVEETERGGKASVGRGETRNQSRRWKGCKRDFFFLKEDCLLDEGRLGCGRDEEVE